MIDLDLTPYNLIALSTSGGTVNHILFLYWNHQISQEQILEYLADIPSDILAKWIDDLVNRVNEAMSFATLADRLDYLDGRPLPAGEIHERILEVAKRFFLKMNFYWDQPAYQPRLTNWRNRERNTIEKHVWNIVAEARDSGELNALDTILDYLLPGCNHQETPQGEKTILSCYEFDDCFCIPQGSEEGIYLHWVLRGRFRQEQKRNTDVHVDIASIKTLQTDLAAYKIMGEAAGVLEYFSRQYVGNNLKLYTPDEELKKR